MTNIIKNPRVTEKVSNLMERNVYTFDVVTSANKTQVAKAIFTLYKVKPVKVNILKVKEKQVFMRGKEGVKKGGKKALVYLKKEDKISEI